MSRIKPAAGGISAGAETVIFISARRLYAGLLSNGTAVSVSRSRSCLSDPLRDLSRFQSGIFDSSQHRAGSEFKRLESLSPQQKPDPRAECRGPSILEAQKPVGRNCSRQRRASISPSSLPATPEIQVALAGKAIFPHDRQLLVDEGTLPTRSSGAWRRRVRRARKSTPSCDVARKRLADYEVSPGTRCSLYRHAAEIVNKAQRPPCRIYCRRRGIKKRLIELGTAKRYAQEDFSPAQIRLDNARRCRDGRHSKA